MCALVSLPSRLTARADQVVTPEATYTKVVLAGYVNGDLHLRLPDASIRPVPLLDATDLVIDSVSGLADFNEAERYFSQKRWPEAATRYERALRQADGFWVAIIHHRLVQVYARQEALDRAVDSFIQVAEDSPTAAARLLPLAVPAGPSAVTQRAFQRLATAVSRAAGDDQRKVFEMQSYAIMLATDHRAADARAREVAQLEVSPAIAAPGAYAVKTLALDRLRANGESDAVLSAVETMLMGCPDTVLPDLLLLKGRALLDRSADRRDLLAAGLAFMRVAIHFSDHALAPEALYWGAKVHEQLERPQQAARLLSECLAHKLIAPELRDRAEVLREKLSGGSAD